MTKKGSLIHLPLTFFSFGKRQKFLFISVLLSACLFSLRFFTLVSRFRLVIGLAILAYLLSVWALREGFNRLSWVTTLVLPAFFICGTGFFYLLVPEQLWLQGLVSLAFGLGFYSLLLTENIFAVAAIRTIQLFRSAQTVGFLITIVTGFFFYNTILSFKLDPWYNLLACIGVSFPLIFQGIWGAQLKDKIDFGDIVSSFIFSLILGELAFTLSFWPVSVSTGSLGLTAGLYIILNLVQHDIAQRLFIKTIKENLVIAIIVFLSILLTTSWSG